MADYEEYKEIEKAVKEQQRIQRREKLNRIAMGAPILPTELSEEEKMEKEEMDRFLEEYRRNRILGFLCFSYFILRKYLLAKNRAATECGQTSISFLG